MMAFQIKEVKRKSDNTIVDDVAVCFLCKMPLKNGGGGGGGGGKEFHHSSPLCFPLHFATQANCYTIIFVFFIFTNFLFLIYNISIVSIQWHIVKSVKSTISYIKVYKISFAIYRDAYRDTSPYSHP